MKKTRKLLMIMIVIFVVFFGSAFVIKGQNRGPVYVHDVSPPAFFIGPFVSEFALNGNREMIDVVNPFVHNGRLYFHGHAFPVTTGNLRQSFEFNTDFGHNPPRIMAVYRGSLRGRIESGHVNYGMLVAGYATRGSIVITHVFFDEESLRNWVSSVRFAFQH